MKSLKGESHLRIGGTSGSIRARDFTVRHGLCRACRHLFEDWPRWPKYDEWKNRYPGDLILPQHPGFLTSWFMDEKGCLTYQNNPRSGRYGQNIYPVYRHASWLAYQDCMLCSLIDAALRLRTSTFDFVDIGIHSWSENLVRIYLRTGDASGQEISFYPSLRLTYINDSASFQYAMHKPMSSTGSQRAMSLLRDRLNLCRRLRPQIQSPCAPTRLIEITNTSSCPNVRLVHSCKLSAAPPYLTLSHRWGGEKSLQLTNKVLIVFQNSMSWGSIPGTFQDAMILTLKIGYRYIWIDSLCIIQDCNSDWEAEAAQMCNVYSNTLLNIFADGSGEEDSGLFHRRDTCTSTGFVTQANWPRMSNSLWHCELSYVTSYEERHLPWLGRTRRTPSTCGGLLWTERHFLDLPSWGCFRNHLWVGACDLRR